MNPSDPPPEPPFTWEPVHPDLLEYARQTLDSDAFMAEVYETLANGGGYQLEDFIDELEAIVRQEGVQE